MKKGKDYIGVGCGAHILNDKKQILLMKRNSNCRNKVGYWGVPGGSINLFEKVEDGLKREIKEEVGIDIEIITLISFTDDIILDENQHWVSPQFLCKIIAGEIQNLEPHKCDDIQWFDLDKLPEKLMNTTKEGIKHLMELI